MLFTNPFLAAIDRPLPLRMRPDLILAEQWFRGRRYHIAKDPLKLTYSYLTEQEYLVLSHLDDHNSLAEIQRRFQSRFAPQQITAGQLHTFVSQLHRSGLVLSESAGQGKQIQDRQQRRQPSDLLRWAERLLVIRWRGFDPEPLLAWLDPKIGWLFSPAGFALWLALVLWATAAAIINVNELSRRLPSASSWLVGDNLLWLGIALIVVKTLHELGHALAARRVGSQCREIGVQLFFLLPCLYTNVSDIWLVPNKWKRIAVSAAGIYVELLLAAIATLLWWRAEEGVLSGLCLSVMVVASVGTLLLNGNPLMRYDGYYILADLLEIPNLEQRSRAQLVSSLARWCTGIEWHPPDELERRPRPMLAAYAAAAVAYRIAVLTGVYLASRKMLQPLGLAPLSDLFLAAAAVGIILPLAATLGQFLMHARGTNELRPWRLAISASVIGVFFAAACLIPLPQCVTAPVIVEPRDSKRIYATVAGTLRHAVPEGTRIQAGQGLVQLENLGLQRDLARLRAEQRQQELRLVELETLRGDDPALAATIPTVRQSLVDLQTRIHHLGDLIDRLTIVAPHDGIVLPPAKQRDSASPRELTAWSGTPLDPENIGASIETGTLLCLVGRPGDLEALAIIDQADAPLVQPGRRASLALPQHPRGIVHGTIAELARIDAKELPLHLVATGAVPQHVDPSGSARPRQAAYEARIRIDHPPETLLTGATGRVMIVAPPETIAARVMRWLGQTFRFRQP